MNKPLVTVYITNFNYGRYIKDSIDSVLNQSFQNFELLIIDDGSTDNSIEIINKYSDNDKIKIIIQDRIGLNATNNIALKQAKGEFIIRLDADDYFENNALEIMIDIIKSNDDVVLMFPDYHIVDDSNSIIRTVRRHNFDEDVTLFDQPAHGACTLIRKNVLLDLGGYDEEFDRQDGYDLWLKVIDNYKVKNINIPLFNYRFHSSNLTKNQFSLLKTRAKIKNKRVKTLGLSDLYVEAIIPIRSESIDPIILSKKKIKGISLLDWTINTAIKSIICDHITVATPDEEIRDRIRSKYGDKVNVLIRKKEHSRFNMPLEKTIIDFLNNLSNKNKTPDALMILYPAYPFKQYWQINEAIDTMKLFNVDVVDGIIPDNRVFYQHRGKGLVPLVDGGGLHMERDELYRRVGGIHLIKTNFFLKHKKMIAGKIGHVQFDKFTAFQINSLIDWNLAETILNNSKD